MKVLFMVVLNNFFQVNIAAQTISNSVADALEFLNEDQKSQKFKGCEATVKFIRTIDVLFDIMNSRNPWAKNFKAPLRLKNEDSWRPQIIEGIKYLLNCTDVSGRPLWCTPKKTPFVGFIMSAISIYSIFDDYVKTGRLSYLLTYKMSQDHLEVFFCAIR